MNPKVIIVLVNWNQYKDTIECLESLKKIDYDNYKVVVVDNASIDNSINSVRSNFQDIEIIQNKENLGFSEGSNVGMRYALEQNADYVLLLNNDTIVDSNFLIELIKVIEKNSEIGMVGPKIYDYYTGRISSAGGAIDWWRGLGIHIGDNKLDKGQFDFNKEFTFLTGCCWLVKKELLYKVGMFDNRYFVYMEDVEFCVRTVKLGYKLFFVPKSRIWHKVSPSLGKVSCLAIYYKTRNRLLFMKQNTRMINYILFLFFFYPSRLIKIVVWLLKGEGQYTIALVMGIYDFYKKRFGRCSHFSILDDKVKIEKRKFISN